MSFGTKVQELRKQKNITQEELADKLEVTRQSISRWETDVAYPDLSKVIQLADLFEVSTDYLLRNEEMEKNQNKECSKFLIRLVGKYVKINCNTDSDAFVEYAYKKGKVLSVDRKFIIMEYVNKKGIVEKVIIKLEDVSSINVLEDN